MTAPLSPPNARFVRPLRGGWIAVPVAAILGLLAAAADLGASHRSPVSRGAQRVSPSATWPQWRGPAGNGVAPRNDPLVTFSATDGVRWKVEIPGRGQSSPVVWDDLVFVTTAVPMDEQRQPGERPRRRRTRIVEHEFRLLAVDRADGRIAWSRIATVATPHERYHLRLSSHANASPVTDGSLVYAFFGSRGLYAYDFGGQLVWSRDFDVQMETHGPFGEASSPALHGDTLVVQFDHEGQSFIEAVDARTGETRWRQLRDERTSWSSPHVVDTDAGSVVVASGGKFITAYDLATGEELWQSPGTTPHPIPTPVAGAGMLVAASGSTGRRVVAIALGAGGATPGEVVWRLDKAAPYNPSPLLWDDELYLVRDGGMNSGTSRLSAIDLRTGTPHYLEKRLAGGYTVKASPVGAADRIYLATEEGDVLVVRRGPEFELLAVNPMGEPFIATPAIAHDQIFLRSRTHLICIGHPDR